MGYVLSIISFSSSTISKLLSHGFSVVNCLLLQLPIFHSVVFVQTVVNSYGFCVANCQLPQLHYLQVAYFVHTVVDSYGSLLSVVSFSSSTISKLFICVHGCRCQLSVLQLQLCTQLMRICQCFVVSFSSSTISNFLLVYTISSTFCMLLCLCKQELHCVHMFFLSKQL